MPGASLLILIVVECIYHGINFDVKTANSCISIGFA